MLLHYLVDGSSRFPFRAQTYRQPDEQTDKQTDATERPTQAGGHAAWVGQLEEASIQHSAKTHAGSFCVMTLTF